MDRIGKKVLLSAGIGLGVAVSGLSLYLLFRPEDDEIYRKHAKNLKVKQSTQSVVTISVPKHMVGAVIGRGGEQIRQIQIETKTRINFDDQNTTDNGLRVLMIRGAADSVVKAQTAINEIIEKQSKIHTKTFSVDTNIIGYIIGRSGDNIRALSDRSGARIKVDRNSKTSKAIMTSIFITGTDEQIAEAVLLIDKEIANRSQSYRQTNRLKNYKLLAIEDQTTSNAIDFDSYFQKLESIEGQLVEVFVSFIKSPDQFYIQMTGSGAQQIDQMMDEMTDFYENHDNRICFKPKSIKVGDVVAVPYQFDEHWYRAQVLTMETKPYSLEESKVNCFYLDFGDEALIEYKQICDLKEEFLRRLPFQAMLCSLSGVAPKDNDWSEEVIVRFKQLSYMALWQKIYAKIIDIQMFNNKRDKYCIQLIDKRVVQKTDLTNSADDEDWETTRVESIDISKELIASGLCVPSVEQTIVSSDQSVA